MFIPVKVRVLNSSFLELFSRYAYGDMKVQGLSTNGARVWGLNFRLSTAVLHEAAAEMATLGLEVKEFFVLDGVEDEPYPAGLARRLTISKPGLALLLRSLESKTLLRREIDPQDLRRHRLTLTPAGHRALTKARNIVSARYGARLARLEDSEREAFGRLLEKLVD
ncbi:MarR family transcriptional regulator [Thioclava sp. BHET1]|nr:MarR family transcriptional regulator [Thioclava sp. BHET1]